MKRRDGLSLVATIAVVALVAILAVATLSVTGRVGQGGSLALRDARLDDAAASGLGAAAAQWRERSIGGLAVGSSMSLTGPAPPPSIELVVTVTRVSVDLFWVVSRASAADSSTRREHLLLRARVPDAEDLVAADATDVVHLGFLLVSAIAAQADLTLPAGGTWVAADGVAHGLGDLTVSGGAGTGILIVDGKLRIDGPLSWTGVIIAKGGVDSGSPSATVSGLVRAPGDPSAAGFLTVTPNHAMVQSVLVKSLRPSHVAGRPWSELY